MVTIARRGKISFVGEGRKILFRTDILIPFGDGVNTVYISLPQITSIDPPTHMAWTLTSVLLAAPGWPFFQVPVMQQ
jgi:hypothetical protein